MKVPVQLYVRVRLDDGSYPYLKAVIQPNGHVRPGYAFNAGRAVKVTGGVYTLRYQRGGKRVWEPIGTDAEVALVKLRKKVREFEDGDTSLVEPQQPVVLPKPKPVRRLLSASIVEYLAEIQEHKLPKTYAAYSASMLSFAESVFSAPEHDGLSLARAAELCIEDITRTHALAWIADLRKKGNQPRTLRNRALNLNTFMRHFSMSSPLTGKDKPSSTKKKVLAYNADVLSLMFDHATEDEADLLYFFICTGAREQDASAVCWSDVDLAQKLYKVTEHLDLGYRPKDKEEEPIPVPDVLVERLIARRKRHPRTKLIFATPNGNRDGHMLRTVKSLALRAGGNCCECVNKQGQSCIEYPVCKHIGLHRLRKTFASTLHNNGLPARTIQRYLRHSDLATTLAYIADQPDEQVRETINATFVPGGIRRKPGA